LGKIEGSLQFGCASGRDDKVKHEGRAVIGAPFMFVMRMRYISLTPSTKALSLRERLG
jgi:hypothetical protein